jgi:hypothetical protein
MKRLKNYNFNATLLATWVSLLKSRYETSNTINLDDFDVYPVAYYFLQKGTAIYE